MGGDRALALAVEDAFPGSRLEVAAAEGVFEVLLRQPGLLRPLRAAELSDGTLRYLMVTAALLTPRPPQLIVLNEPEQSMHSSLLPALARMMVRASRHTQVVVVTHSTALAAELGSARDGPGPPGGRRRHGRAGQAGRRDGRRRAGRPAGPARVAVAVSRATRVDGTTRGGRSGGRVRGWRACSTSSSTSPGSRPTRATPSAWSRAPAPPSTSSSPLASS
ncbi:AAA family ATPase [Georgenia sp. SUBG003]|uniref:AAA family ATPase n=1 Tax=Georgenia sp. SUBG003 TaxID=1497974 RepID=UPI003AB88360